MLTVLRHTLAVLLLPTVMTIVVPRWIVQTYAAVDSRWPPGAASWISRALGVTVVIAGLGLVMVSRRA